MGFSSTAVDEDDDDKFAAAMESWQASIKRQAELVLSLAMSRKRNDLLQRRKDGSVIQEIMLDEFKQLEQAFALEEKKHKDAQDGLRRWGMGVEVKPHRRKPAQWSAAQPHCLSLAGPLARLVASHGDRPGRH